MEGMVLIAAALRTGGGPVRAYGPDASSWYGTWTPGLRLVHMRPSEEIFEFGDGTWCVLVAVLRGRTLHLDRTTMLWSRVAGGRVPTVLRQARRLS